MYFKRKRVRLTFASTKKNTSLRTPCSGRGAFYLRWVRQQSVQGNRDGVIEMTVVKVFYFSGDSLCGRLRTVLYDSMHFVRLSSSQVFTYLGDRLPQMNIGDPPAAIIELLPDAQRTGWRTGFYLAAQPPVQFEQTLRAVCDY
jgi:hypothetical protein